MMEAKKVTIQCKSCGEEMLVDFETANFSTEVQVLNGKKKNKRVFFEPCKQCETINTITSENPEEWGTRKGPNLKVFMFSSLFSCLGIVLLSAAAIFFAIKGVMTIFGWLFQ
jgi:hypothetical protein